MFRGLALLSIFSALPIFGANVQLFTLLPSAAQTFVIQLDSTGNIYVAGTYQPASASDSGNAFVAKLSPDGSQVIYFTTIGGESSDGVTALAVASDGSVYVAGYTSSPDFPVTPGAFQTTFPGGGTGESFLAKLNPAGTVTYSSYINGVLGSFTQITGMTLDSAGELFLTGIGGPGNTTVNNFPEGFILKMDAAMSKILLSVYGYGGGLIQLDSQGNMYVAGSAQPAVGFTTTNVFTLPQLPSTAFQSTHAARFCETFGGGPGGFAGSIVCRYQYVAKLDPTGAPIWATYLTGTYGAIPRGMAVDSAGNVIVAGTTFSDDYPVTAGAFQTAYSSAAPPFPNSSGNGYSPPPPTIGYLSKINSTGTNLIWSTYFGGSFADEVTGLAVNSAGEIFISGRAASADLPGLENTADGCQPSSTQVLGFVARVSPDGATAGPAQLIAGAPDCSYLNCSIQSDFPSYTASWPLALRSDGTLLTAGTAGTVADVNFASSSRLSCVADPADNVQLRTIAPGQLLSLFGTDLAPVAPLAPAGGVQKSTANFGVTFNGIAAPILYAAGQQINIQVPYEIAGQTSVTMQVADNQVGIPVAESHTFAVAAQEPAIFLSPTSWLSPQSGYIFCGSQFAMGELATAINADGTLNSCANPAVAGSTVTVFVNGLGVESPALTTGAIEPAPPVALTPGLSFLNSNLASVAVTTSTVPGAISGIAQVQFQVPPSGGALIPYQFSPQLQASGLRERVVMIWEKPN
jgi:uncharacterized protein (TIGR03437 family)